MVFFQKWTFLSFYIKCIFNHKTKTQTKKIFLSLNVNIQLENDASVCRNEIEKSHLFDTLFMFKQSPVNLQK